MLKKILIAVVVLLIIIGIGLYYVVSNIDDIAKNLIEESGSKVLGTPVTVGSVSIVLKEGSASIKNLSVANPPGFSDNPAFSFGEVTAVIDIGSGVVKRIFTSRPAIRVEFQAAESNFDVLQKNIDASMPAGESTEAEEAAESGADEAPVSLQIDEIVIEQAQATVTSDQYEEPLELNIERLQFDNLKGSPEQVARVALGQFVAQVLAATARSMIEKKADQVIEEQGDKLKSKLKGLLE